MSTEVEFPEFPANTERPEVEKSRLARRQSVWRRRISLPGLRTGALPGMRLRVSERRALLFTVDVLLITAALFFAVWLVPCPC